MKTDTMPCEIIYPINVFTTKNPNKQTDESIKFALINTCKPKDEKFPLQRQVLTIEWQGEEIQRLLVNTIQLFETEEVALYFAKKSNIPMAHFKDKPHKVAYLSAD